MKPLTEKNHRWIYTYDYAPESVWEEWRSETGDPEWIEDEADAVADRALDITGGKALFPAFILLADSHFVHNGTWENTFASMRALEERIPLSGIIHLGDLTDGLLPLKQTERLEKRCINDMESLGLPVYITPGNHDYNYFKGNPEICYPERPQFFEDIEFARLRLIFIDSFDPKEGVRYGFTDYCVHWLDALLDRMPEGYKAVIFSHLTPLVRLQAWTNNIRNREKLISVLDRHADNILSFINGHNHCDHLFNDLKNGKFPIISINCAKCEYFTEHKPEGAEVPERRLGDRTEQSFDILQIDTEERRLYFTRFGAGRDRVVENGKAMWV